MSQAPPSPRRRALLVGALAVIGALVLFLVAEGPIFTTWYHARQQALAFNLNQPKPRTNPGDALGVLQIPKLGLNLVVGEGDNPSQLRAGPGHRIGSPVPGGAGNAVVFGHRHGWGGPFADLGQVVVGDEVFFKARLGQPELFVVTNVAHTSAGDRRPFARSTDHRLTLVTGSGSLGSSKRLVITAVSGSTGKLNAPSSNTSASTPGRSLLFNVQMLLVVLLAAAAVAAQRVLPSRYRRAMVAVVLAPFVLGATLALLVNLDLLLPPLR